MSPDPQRVTVSIGERELQLSSLDKPLYPSGFTKRDVIDYYARIAPVLLSHLAGRPVTVKRFPQGSHHPGFIEKNVPKHAPAWIRTVTLPRRPDGRWGAGRDGRDDREQREQRDTTRYVMVDELATVVWLANLAALEFHTPMWRVGPDATPLPPDLVVFDLDPGAPADIAQCCRVALRLRERAGADGVDLVPKTSGSKGLQLYAPVAGAAWGPEETVAYAHALAEELEADDPGLVVSRMAKALRTGRVLIDWSQNSGSKTTVSAYSLRALDRPTVSTPLTWDEVEAGVDGGADTLLGFGPHEVLARVDDGGDLFEVLVGPGRA